MLLTWRNAKRLVIFIVGMTVLLIGVLLGWMPFVPAIIIIPAGLAILATEFVWAKKLLDKVKKKAQKISDTFIKNRHRDPK